jgi:dihydrolipoamide dehydrogenase
MSMKYDVVIIGGGPGGYVAAIKSAHLGGRVLLVEKEQLGGVCLNKGCIPTKTLLRCSGLYKTIQEAGRFGIGVEGVTLDFAKMMGRKREVVSTLVNGIKGLLKANGVDVVKGEGKILDASRVQVHDRIYEAGNIILATGSKPFIPGIKGSESPHVMDSDALLSMEKLPSSIAIIGGGVIGVEFAVLLSELGCKVTILEMMEEILAMADEDVIRELKKILRNNGVDIVTTAKVTEIQKDRVFFEKEGEVCSLTSEKVLVAVGRVPNTDAAELDRLSILHTNGKIHTDDKMRTNVPGIYAIGDVNGKYMLAHVASEEGIVAAETIFGQEAGMKYAHIPQCIYSHPEIAWVGLTEREAREKGYDVRIGKFPMSANGKSIAEGEASGFMKVITDSKYNEILGVHMVCSHATDMVSEATLALNLEATAVELAQSIHPHPTMSEALMEAAQAALVGKAIHSV